MVRLSHPPPDRSANGSESAGPCLAENPWQIGWRHWKQILARVRKEVVVDHLSLVAAGAAFFAFLSIVPALAALTALYGVLAEPTDVQEQMGTFTALLPTSAAEVLRDQLLRLATAADDSLGWGVVVGLFVALWSANRGMKGIIEAIGVAYDQREQRGFVRLNLLTFSLTGAALVAVGLVLALVAGIPVVLDHLGLDPLTASVVDVLRWPVILMVFLLAFAVLYYLAPNRERPRWHWVTPGSLLASVLLLAASAGFSLYVSNFGNYNETYGSLTGVALLMLWLYLGAYVILLGAELNAESERQTACDTTVGPSRPVGSRGAAVADDVASDSTDGGERPSRSPSSENHGTAPIQRRHLAGSHAQGRNR